MTFVLVYIKPKFTHVITLDRGRNFNNIDFFLNGMGFMAFSRIFHLCLADFMQRCMKTRAKLFKTLLAYQAR